MTSIFLAFGAIAWFTWFLYVFREERDNSGRYMDKGYIFFAGIVTPIPFLILYVLIIDLINRI